MLAAPMFFVLSGCVLRYGEPPVEAPLDYGEPAARSVEGEFVDLYDLERSFKGMIHDNDVDIDTQKRLELAGELARRTRSLDLGAQKVVSDYLSQLSELESNAAAHEVTQLESGFVGPSPAGVEIGDAGPVKTESPPVSDSVDPLVTVEELGDTSETGESAPMEMGPSVERDLAEARELLYAWDHVGAMEVLQPLRGGDNAEAVEALWGQAVDGIVHASRERAGERFIRARRLTAGPQKIAEMKAVLQTLEALLEEYPETTYRNAVERNIRVVRKDLSQAEE